MATALDLDSFSSSVTIDVDISDKTVALANNFDTESDHSYDDCASLFSSPEMLTQVTFEKCVLTIDQVVPSDIYEPIRQHNFQITNYKPSLIIEKENTSVEDIIKIRDLIQRYMEQHKQICLPSPVLKEDHDIEAVKVSCKEKDKIPDGLRLETGEAKKNNNTLTKVTEMSTIGPDRGVIPKKSPESRDTKDQAIPTSNKESTMKNEVTVLQPPKETIPSKAEGRNMSELCRGKTNEKARSGPEKCLDADNKGNIESKRPDSDVKTHYCVGHVEQQLKMKNKSLQDEKDNFETTPKYNNPMENDMDTQSDEEDRDTVNLISINKKVPEFKALKFYFADTEYTSYFTKEPNIEIHGNSKQGKFFRKMLKGIGIEMVPYTFIDPKVLKNLNFDDVNVKLLPEKNNIILVGPKEELKTVKSKIISRIGNQDQSTQWSTKLDTATMEDEGNEHDFDGTKRNKDKIAVQGACKNLDKEQPDTSKSYERHSPISKVQAQRSFIKSLGVLPIYAGHMNNKLSITIEYFDITKLKVDVVVNAANIRLRHGGGVAKAIAKAAGEDLTKECDKYIDKNEKLAVTEVFVSTAGKLPSKKVIHAVGPKWDAYEDKEKCVNDLRQTVLRCLIEASKLKMSSIALPSISAAIFKVPKDKCAKCYMEASKNYDYITHRLKIPPVQTIIFVDVDKSTLNIIQECFIRNWNLMPDNNQMQDDLGFVERTWEKDIKPSKSFSALLPSSGGGKKPSANPTFRAAKGEWDDYQIKDIILRIRTEPVVNFKADLNIVLGPAFNKLSGITDFEVQKCLDLAHKFPSQSNVFQYFVLKNPSNKPHQSSAALLCIVYPPLKTEDDFKLCFEHLNKMADMDLLFAEMKPSPSSLTLTSSFLFPENHKERNYHKMVGKLACKLFEFIDKLSQIKHTIKKVTICTSEETAPHVFKVFDSRKLIKVSRSFDLQQVNTKGLCTICFNSKKETRLPCCNKKICYDCFDKIVVCPFCKTHLKILRGHQPNGTMTCFRSIHDLKGYEGFGSLEITYKITGGTQTAEHLSPGKHFSSVERVAYLPATDEGIQALGLLRVAFLRRLVFTIDVSHSTQHEGVVWNIHHKTSRTDSPYGFPDPTYLKRLFDELKNNGVTLNSMNEEERRSVSEFVKRLNKTTSTRV